MPLALQAKLLRALQDRSVRPVGSTEMVPINVRIISATHRDLSESIRSGAFRPVSSNSGHTRFATSAARGM